MKQGESSDPYYDLIEDFDLIVASFLTQYGIRLYSDDINTMCWQEFKTLLAGVGPETPLGRIVAIRAEDDKEILKNFTKEEKRIRSEWRNRTAKKKETKDVNSFYESMKNALLKMAGGADG